MPTSDHNVWVMMFESTPPALRWVLSILTLGLFGLAGVIWRRYHERIAIVESRINSLATKEDVKRLESGVGMVHRRVDDIYTHLIKGR